MAIRFARGRSRTRSRTSRTIATYLHISIFKWERRAVTRSSLRTESYTPTCVPRASRSLRSLDSTGAPSRYTVMTIVTRHAWREHSHQPRAAPTRQRRVVSRPLWNCCRILQFIVNRNNERTVRSTPRYPRFVLFCPSEMHHGYLVNFAVQSDEWVSNW